MIAKAYIVFTQKTYYDCGNPKHNHKRQNVATECLLKNNSKKLEKDQREGLICGRFKDGENLESIGQSLGVTRERVRQILKTHGITGIDGGQHVTAEKKAIKSIEKQISRSNNLKMNSFGCTLHEYKQYREMHIDYKKTPIHYFREQKRTAKNRGIEWDLTINEWWSIWKESGKWEERGRNKDEYVMARLRDEGGYSVENVRIVTSSENIKEYYEHHKDEWLEKRFSIKSEADGNK